MRVIEDVGYSAKDMRRPGIQEALATLERGDAGALVVAKLDRLSRSMLDFAAIMTKAQRQGWALIALDAPVDTTTPAGEAMAHVLATFARFERRLIGQRTREALATRKAQGVRLGRPPQVPANVERRIVRERKAGAAGLNAAAIPTARGAARWAPETVRVVARRAEAKAKRRP